MKTKTPIALGCLLAAGALAAAGCGGSDSGSASPAAANDAVPAANTTPAANNARAASTASKGTVDVALSEYKIVPAVASAPAGKVKFTVTNDGKIPHEMVVLKTDKAAGSLGTGARVSEKDSVGEAGDIAPGKTKSVTLHLKSGHYVLICNIPGHYAGGMHAAFTVN